MKQLILCLMSWLLDRLYPEVGAPRSNAARCPDKVEVNEDILWNRQPSPQLPSFVVEAQRNRLELEHDYDELHDEWSRYINDPDVIANARIFLEHQWRR